MKIIYSTLLIILFTGDAMAQNNPNENDIAPEINGIDQHGDSISSLNLLEKNDHLVLIFYRGSWCPYCRKQVSNLQDSLQLILDKNASVVVVTPEKSESMQKMISKTGASFSILQDENYKIMKGYGVDFKINETTVPKHYTFVLNSTRKSNENEDDILPVPATFIINNKGKIKYIHYDTDYKVRASVKTILERL